MDAYFDANQIESIHFWPETTSKVTPLYLAKRGSYFLPKFTWYEDLRPFDKFDIFTVPLAMRTLLKEAPPIKEEYLNGGDRKVASPNSKAPRRNTESTAPAEVIDLKGTVQEEVSEEGENPENEDAVPETPDSEEMAPEEIEAEE